MCYLTDSLEAALNFMKKAETLLISLKDSTDMADILNGFGNIYMAKENYNLAETYFKKGIEYDKEESAPDYLALAQLCLYRKDFDQAQKKTRKGSIVCTYQLHLYRLLLLILQTRKIDRTHQ